MLLPGTPQPGSSLTDSSCPTNEMVGVRGSGAGLAAKGCAAWGRGPRQLDTRPQEEATPAPSATAGTDPRRLDGSVGAAGHGWPGEEAGGQVARHLSQEQRRTPGTHLRVEDGSHGFKGRRGERRFGAITEASWRKGAAELPWELGGSPFPEGKTEIIHSFVSPPRLPCRGDERGQRTSEPTTS